MPIISRIGAKSWKTRMVYGTIFVVLTIGAATMIYPFTLMLSGSVKSETDSIYITPYPRYWFNDLLLFQKYAESKYNVTIGTLWIAWRKMPGGWRELAPPETTDEALLDDFLAWRAREDFPLDWYTLGHTGGAGMLPVNARLFRKRMYDEFEGDIDAFSKAAGAPIRTWSSVVPPAQAVLRYTPDQKGLIRYFNEFRATRPARDRIIIDVDGQFVQNFLIPKYTRDIDAYNQSHGTAHASYRDVFLTRRVPETAGLVRREWEEYVREQLYLRFIRLDADLAGAYRKLLADYYETVDELNTQYDTRYASFDQVPFTTTAPKRRIEQVDWERFIKDRDLCPAESIEVYGPRQAFEEFVAKRRGVPVEQVTEPVIPQYEADYHDAEANASSLRWEFTLRNYRHVLDYILLHGHGIVNTVIFCALMIATALLVNPLAAYALSRYKPPSTYKVLLFCMATMAFPVEVTMIPNFLLLKRFPLWPIVGGAAAFFVIMWISGKVARRWSENVRMLVALGAGVLAGWWLIPLLLHGEPTVSLLNTFAALVLPRMANGYYIFLLKGFFDSLPQELYEAAELDGAGEFTKFWTITMNLSKPILAVIALQAFTAAYSAFMMALIIIPDPDMWTLMVWIFQLQSQSHQSVIYASLVIAAVPTLVVFIFCQNIIIRGIVVPVEK